tara:strand:+ start:875 stop:1063 length:189 start_codon:yes stop_codon:yes gene_type:complete
MQNDNDIREAGIEAAYKYLRQKDWERMNKQCELMATISLGLWITGVAVLAVAGIYAVLFGGL